MSDDSTIEFLRSKGVTRVSLVCTYDMAVESDSDLGQSYDTHLIIIDECLIGSWDNSSPDYHLFPRRVPVISDESDIDYMQYDAWDGDTPVYSVMYNQGSFSVEVYHD